ncbi:MAG: sensor histidine kinase [Ginsengibacter sp.]
MNPQKHCIKLLFRRRYYQSILLLLIAFCFSNPLLSQSKIIAKNGVLDLSEWNWKKNGVANLDGQWEFYWNTLYDPSKPGDLTNLHPDYIYVPGFWDSKVPGNTLLKPAFGFATYRLKIICPQNNLPLELKFLTVSSAFKLFVNGQELLEIGKVGTSRATEIPQNIPYIIPVEPLNNELNLTVQVSDFNYSSGGLWDNIKLGTRQQVRALWIKNVGIDFFTAGSFFLMGIFFIVIFFCFKNRLVSLYFGIFCMLLAIRPLLTDELAILYLANWNWAFIKHAEFVSLYLMVPVLSLFSYELFPNEFSKKILHAIIYITLPFILLAIFAPPYIFRYSLRPFELVIILSSFYALYVYTKAVKNRRPGSVYFLISFIILFITIINDLLYNSLIIQSTNLVYLGIFILIISQAIALSRQFFWAYSNLEVLNNKLELINGELNEKNIEIIEANDQLTKLNSELDIFVSKTSHDLRSPLTSVVALVHIIKNEKDEEKRYGYLEMQRRTLHRLNILITDILDFSRNKRTQLNYEVINFKEIVTYALQDHQFADNSAHIERIAEIKQENVFMTDKVRLNMILYNLISNALKYHDKEKTKPYLRVEINSNNVEATIKIIDNGSGISQKDLAHIFTMFYQVDNNTKGSGLGLYIVKEAAEKLGGTIKIDSTLLVGTTFTVFIPNHIADNLIAHQNKSKNN